MVKHAIANPNKSSPCSTEALLLREILLVGCTWSSPPSLHSSGFAPCHAVALVPEQGTASPDPWSPTRLLRQTLRGGKCSHESSDSCINTAKKISPYSAVQRGAPPEIHRGSQTVAEPWSIPGRLMGVALERKAGIVQVTDSKSSNSRSVLQLLVHDLALLGLWVPLAVL